MKSVKQIKCKNRLFCLFGVFSGFFHLTLITVTSITCELLISEQQLVNGVPAKKMRVEIFNDGDRYTITFERQVTRDKALRLLDLVELLGGMPTVNSGTARTDSELPKIEKVRLVAEKNFPVGWFSSKELQAVYEKQFNEPISLSTSSTYLSRLASRGFFIKKGGSNQIRYKIMTAMAKYPIHER